MMKEINNQRKEWILKEMLKMNIKMILKSEVKNPLNKITLNNFKGKLIQVMKTRMLSMKRLEIKILRNMRNKIIIMPQMKNNMIADLRKRRKIGIINYKIRLRKLNNKRALNRKMKKIMKKNSLKIYDIYWFFILIKYIMPFSMKCFSFSSQTVWPNCSSIV